MPNDCLHKNPLLHSGTSQWGRVLKALHPSFAQVDERSAADLILFAREYSRYLTYYNLQNEPDGNWQPMMRMDVSIILATLANQHINDYFGIVSRELAWIGDRNNTDEAGLSLHFTFLFSFAISWLYELETQCRQLPDDWPFKAWLTDTIRSRFAAQRYKLLQYYDKAKAEGCLSGEQLPAGIPLPFTLNTVPQLQAAYWQDCWAFIPDPDQPFQPELHGTTVVAKIKNTAVHNLFTGIFDAIFKQGGAMVQAAGVSLEQTFEGYPRHAPHYALFLTFIRLYRFAQQELNGFTQRHLNLYYKDILQLQPLPAQPDHAHLLITLQKNIQNHLVPAGTLFKAGKDAGGQELFYAAEKDVVINKATVAALKSVFAVAKKSGSLNWQTVYAAPVANSADGLGAAITTEDKSWLPFGPQLTGNRAETGFAIATHLLYMQEGDRTVLLTFESESNLPVSPYLFSIKPLVQLTGAKGWEDAGSIVFKKDKANPKKFYLSCHLTPKAAAIVPFDAKLHQAAFQTPYPVMRVIFKSPEGFNAGLLWGDVLLSRVNLQVAVLGLKKLAVRNDLSILDTSKPFAPFGPAPYAGSACIIGSKEIFQKEGAQVKLSFSWDKVPQPEGIISHMSIIKSGEPISDPVALHDFSIDYAQAVAKARLYQLSDGSWGGSTGEELLFAPSEMYGTTITDNISVCTYIPEYTAAGLFTEYPKDTIATAPTPDITFTVSDPIEPDFTPDPGFGNQSVNGYIRLELNHDLGHKDFIQRFTQLATKQKKPPLDPYTPQAKALTADYTASLDLDFTQVTAEAFRQKKWQFFSLYPFGLREEHRSLNNGPHFSIDPSFNDEGQLFIGLDAAPLNSSLQLLFQVSDGSANPLRTKQEVVWQYLAVNNQWKPFGKGKVTDDTNGLLHSGIISFGLPNDLANGPTLMGGALSWLRAAVHVSSDAICNLIDVKAQAIKVIWTDAKSTGNTFSQPAPAGTISKLLLADPAIKKTEQPYNSFGGRLPETEEPFYLRSSERLRHKKRAITIWDYERLVLAAFPEIYKVKCLNHTRIRTDALGNEVGDNEMAPGCVVVVPVPDISKLHSRNPLRPLTSLDTLTRIEDFLRPHTSGLVRLQVRNPVFEEVVIHCDVQFIGNDPAYYHDVLLEDLQRFMCPWAYNTQSDIEFGGKISKSILINFIEERPYVDYITRFIMRLRIDGVIQPVDREEIAASTSRAILVSAPKELQFIEYLNVMC